ncbi:MAG: TerB family tellurite resistance protein [Planctomycetota bacterium]|nr:TerB family tellurite resistance protein [Planctomycetota bacterium]
MSVMYKVEILRAACCVAGIDGDTTDRERSMLTKLANQIGVGEASLQAMIDRAESDSSFCDEQFILLKTKPDNTMKILLQVALADHELTDNECGVLQQFAERLGLAADRFQRVLEQTKKDLDSRRDSAD